MHSDLERAEALISGYTRLVGLLAYPIRHSHSPAMQTGAFRKAGIDCVQLAFEVDNSTLEDAAMALFCCLHGNVLADIRGKMLKR